jgi:hypothetical protein
LAADDRDNFELKIRYDDPSALEVLYATNLAVQSTAHEYILNFYAIMPPLIVGTDDEKRAAIKALGGRVTATPLARVVVAASKIEEFIDLLQKQVDDRAKKVQVTEEAQK